MNTSEYGLLLLVIILIIIAGIQFRSIQNLTALVRNRMMPKGNGDDFNSTEPINEPLTKIDKKQIKDLKAQLKSKTVELAKIAKENGEKSQIINEIKEKVEHCANNPTSLPRVTKDVLALLDSVIISTDSTFEIQLDELHQEFSKKLKSKYPDLTTHDLRLATYIKIGLNSKEISELLNIKPSSVYISRSRLRKKIDLDTDTDLHGYLNSF